MIITLSLFDWLMLFGQFLLLSLLSFGGVISTVPDMHRVLVDKHHWLFEGQFNLDYPLGLGTAASTVASHFCAD